MRTDFDAVIVGAGPAGATAAALLARAGWAVAVVEQQAFPRRKVCGECVAASNLPLLDALGLGAEIDRRAGPELKRVALLRGERCVIAELPPAPGASGRRWGRAIGRETLDTLLLDRARAAGAHVLQPWSAEAIDGSAGDWRLTVRPLGPRQGAAAPVVLRAPVAIDAHGSWQALAVGDAAHRRAHRASDLLAFKADFRGAALADGLLPVLSFDGGYGGMVMGEGGVATVACCIRRDRLHGVRRDAPGASAGEAVEALLGRECAGVRAALHGAERDGAWLAAGPLDPGVRLPRSRRDGPPPLRIGNAAGEAHPILGEGMSMALQSAWLLCARLLEGGGVPADAAAHAAVARLHAADWKREFAPRLLVAAAFAHAAMRPVAADALLALAARWPGLLTLGARHGGKVRCAADAATVARLAGPSTPTTRTT